MARRHGWLVVTAAAGSLLLTGCTDEDDGARGGAPVEIRRVITSSPLAGGCHASAEACRAWAGFTCPGDAQRLDGDLLMACGAGDDADQPYLLDAAEIVGGVESAAAVHRDRIDQSEVELQLDPEATEAFADLTADLVPTSAQLAIVLDGEVVSAPAVQTLVTDGEVRLAGDYTEAEAEELAHRIAP